MTNRFALALCAAVLGAGSAAAADLPRKAPLAAPITPPVYNWTGFYVGVHAGWVWSDVDSGAAFSVGGPPAFGFSLDADGGMLGGQIGFNYQVGNWVVGLEADISWTGVEGSFTTAPLGIFPGSSYTATYDMNWFGTVRGRLGFAANNLLIYVTGGLAYADIDFGVVAPFPVPGFTFTGGFSETRAGWTIGAGLEWGFAPNWSLKAEYLYYDLGDVTVTAFTAFGPPLPTTTTTFDNDGHILRLGLNYRFGWGGPVVARY